MQISDGRESHPPNHCWCQKTRAIDLSCGIKILQCLALCDHISRMLQTDRQADGRRHAHGISATCVKPHLNACSMIMSVFRAEVPLVAVRLNVIAL